MATVPSSPNFSPINTPTYLIAPTAFKYPLRNRYSVKKIQSPEQKIKNKFKFKDKLIQFKQGKVNHQTKQKIDWIINNILIGIYKNWIRLQPILGYKVKEIKNWKIKNLQFLIQDIKIRNKQIDNKLRQLKNKGIQHQKLNNKQKIILISSENIKSNFITKVQSSKDIQFLKEINKEVKYLKGHWLKIKRNILLMKENQYSQEILLNFCQTKREHKGKGLSTYQDCIRVEKIAQIIHQRLQEIQKWSNIIYQIDNNYQQMIKKPFQDFKMNYKAMKGMNIQQITELLVKNFNINLNNKSHSTSQKMKNNHISIKQQRFSYQNEAQQQLKLDNQCLKNIKNVINYQEVQNKHQKIFRYNSQFKNTKKKQPSQKLKSCQQQLDIISQNNSRLKQIYEENNKKQKNKKFQKQNTEKLKKIRNNLRGTQRVTNSIQTQSKRKSTKVSTVIEKPILNSIKLKIKNSQKQQQFKQNFKKMMKNWKLKLLKVKKRLKNQQIQQKFQQNNENIVIQQVKQSQFKKTKKKISMYKYDKQIKKSISVHSLKSQSYLDRQQNIITYKRFAMTGQNFLKSRNKRILKRNIYFDYDERNQPQIDYQVLIDIQTQQNPALKVQMIINVLKKLKSQGYFQSGPFRKLKNKVEKLLTYTEKKIINKKKIARLLYDKNNIFTYNPKQLFQTNFLTNKQVNIYKQLQQIRQQALKMQREINIQPELKIKQYKTISPFQQQISIQADYYNRLNHLKKNKRKNYFKNQTQMIKFTLKILKNLQMQTLCQTLY